MALRDQLRVMVVDDMSTSRGIIVQALDSFGIRIISTAEDGKSALLNMAKSPVHLVISDYNMPNMDGLHLLQNIRQNEQTKGIGFILITGRAEQEIIDCGRKLGMNNYIKKPFDPTDLRKCIEVVVGNL